MNIRGQIKADIFKVVSGEGLVVSREQIEVIRTTDPRFGDFATNAAFRLPLDKFRVAQGKKLAKGKHTPIDFANFLADSMARQSYVEKAEVAGPGFVNIWVGAKVWVDEVNKILSGKSDKRAITKGTEEGEGMEKKARRVVVEFTDPNPFKEFHIGHLYSNIVGESISRLLAAQGAVVRRVCYQGDVGLHVAKAVWGIRAVVRSQKSEVRSLEKLAKENLKDRVRFLGEAYAQGAKAYEEDEEAKGEIVEINREVFEKGEEIPEYKLGRAWSLEYFEQIYRRLGTKFEAYYYESEVGKIGAEMVKAHIKDGIFRKSQGAIVYPGEKEGLHSRVFINSLGLPTYEAKELGLAPKKYQDWAYDLSIIITGNEIDEYFKVLLAALSKIEPELAAKTRHISHGMVRMPEGKLSSRKGKVLSGEWLLDEAKRRLMKNYPELDAESAEMVAVAAVKYALLKGDIGRDVKFNFDESISLNGNSGPYVQYTHARAKSVLEKEPSDIQRGDFDGVIGVEREILVELGNFPDVVIDAAQRFSPIMIATYLYGLATKYNKLYNDLPILKASEIEKARRLFLTKGTAEVLKRGMWLLGIEAPEKM